MKQEASGVNYVEEAGEECKVWVMQADSEVMIVQLEKL